MESTNGSAPEGISSLLDTDLYKLTMQCAIHKHFPDVRVAYAFTNRTPHMKLNRKAFHWLQEQIHKLGNIHITKEETAWLRKAVPALNEEYLRYLNGFHLHPEQQVVLDFNAEDSEDGEKATGDLEVHIRGLWLETILWEVPVLSLVSEAYFKFVDTDWDYTGQMENAKDKGIRLLSGGCVFSEFGTRRRRDYKTHDLVIQGLVAASKEASTNGENWTGKFAATSNVHFAMKHGIAPTGTVAHEWIMGIAALTDDYANANEIALEKWIGTYGRGNLAIALTDTFGTPAFLKAFSKPAPKSKPEDDPSLSYAQVFTGVRQDSGDPLEYLSLVRKFYTAQSITNKKVIVYSDALNTEKCLRYRTATEEAGLMPSFGIGTFLTNDFKCASRPDEKSVPLNIVIKLSEAGGNPCVKLSDNQGKNMGDGGLLERVKSEVDYREQGLNEELDEAHRWDK